MSDDYAGEQQENLDRVSARIKPTVRRFFRSVLEKTDKRFHADDLRQAVIRETGIAAPASADRVMRNMRQCDEIDYVVISRRQSLYEARRVGRDHTEKQA